MADSDRRISLWLFLCASLGYMLTAGGHFYASDDVQKLATLQSLYNHGSLAIDEGWAKGVDSQRYAWFPIGSWLLMVPGFAVARCLMAVAPGLPEEAVVHFCVAMENSAFTAVSVALFYLLLRTLGRSAATSMVVSAWLGLATMLWPYAKTSWSEPSATALVLGAVIALATSRLRPAREAVAPLLAAGGCLGLAVLIRQELALVAIGTVAWVLWQRRTNLRDAAEACAFLVLPMAGSLALTLWYEAARFGHYLALPGYRMPQDQGGVPLRIWQRVSFSLVNLYRYTISPNQGVFWFSPPVLLGVLGWLRFRRDQPAIAALLVTCFLPLAVFYIYGWGFSTWAWGMRYTYFFVPFALVAAAWLWDAPAAPRKLCLAIVAAGVLVQGLGVLHDSTRLYGRALQTHRGLSIYDVMAEPRIGPLALAVENTPTAFANGYALLTSPRASNPIPLAQHREVLPDQWGVLLFLGPIKGIAVVTAWTGLLLLWLGALFRLRRAFRDGQAGEVLPLPAPVVPVPAWPTANRP